MRISRDEWALRLAEVTALRGTCLRRRVGCVLTDGVGRVLATGYNGVARGELHCNEEASVFLTSAGGYVVDHPNACAAAFVPSGSGLDLCAAVHAEQNACLQCREPNAIHTCYVTVSPCVSCVKLLMNTGCLRVVFREPYAQDAEALWTRQGKEWRCLKSS
jgi:dCMP deaminase